VESRFSDLSFKRGTIYFLNIYPRASLYLHFCWFSLEVWLANSHVFLFGALINWFLLFRSLLFYFVSVVVMLKNFFPINLVLANIIYNLINCNGWILSSINSSLFIIVELFLFISKDLFKLADYSVSTRRNNFLAQLNRFGTVKSTGLDLTVVLKVVFIKVFSIIVFRLDYLVCW
jgi:hypothetical protein